MAVTPGFVRHNLKVLFRAPKRHNMAPCHVCVCLMCGATQEVPEPTLAQIDAPGCDCNADERALNIRRTRQESARRRLPLYGQLMADEMQPKAKGAEQIAYFDAAPQTLPPDRIVARKGEPAMYRVPPLSESDKVLLGGLTKLHAFAAQYPLPAHPALAGAVVLLNQAFSRAADLAADSQEKKAG